MFGRLYHTVFLIRSCYSSSFFGGSFVIISALCSTSMRFLCLMIFYGLGATCSAGVLYLDALVGVVGVGVYCFMMAVWAFHTHDPIMSSSSFHMPRHDRRNIVPKT